MAKAEKLPSGNWRVRVYVGRTKDGKKITKSFTGKTRAEAEFLAAQWQVERPEEDDKPKLTVGQVVDQYIDLSQTLSPTTLSRYRTLREHGLPGLMKMDVDDLTDAICQQEINLEIKRPNKRTGKALSAKTIKEEWSLVSSSLKTICHLSYSVKLPKIIKPIKELPAPESVLNAIKGTDIELPCLLSVWLSFSLSEIRGLKASSIRDNKIYIDQVIVQVDGLPVEKRDTKVDSRRRAQSVPEYIMDLIRQTDAYKVYQETGTDGYLCPVTENIIYHRLQKVLRDAGVPAISFHDLRHMFASIMLTRLQIPEKVVQEEGGWSTPHVMKSVYSNTFSDSRKMADEIRDKFFEDVITTSHGSPQT